MKKRYCILLAIFILASFSTGCSNKDKTANGKPVEYKDGTYEAQTGTDIEGYHCEAKVTISNGKITDVKWNIIDKNGLVFDENYEKVFKNNEEFIQQCRSDFKGSRNYGPELIQKQNVNRVDAVSGATWSNKKFKAVISEALAKAEK